MTDFKNLSNFEILSILIGREPAKLITKLVGSNLLKLHNIESELPLTEKNRLKAAIELGRRLAQGKRPERISVGSPDKIANYLMQEMRYFDREHFMAVLLDSQNRVISIENISVGSINSSMSIPREIFNIASKKNAMFIILVHNHPSGDSYPSAEDVSATERIIEAGKIMGIHVLDHIVVGDGEWFSFVEADLI